MTRRARAIGLYALVAYGVTWAVWLPYVLAAREGRELPSPYLYYLASFGPLAGAMVAEAYERGTPGIQDLLNRLLDPTREPRWILVGLFSPLVLPLVAALVLFSAGQGWPEWSEVGITSRAPGMGPFATWLLMILSFGIGEEVGWRGFLLPRLQHGRSALAATARLTLIWAGWHTPAFLFREGYVGLGISGITGFLLGLAAGAVVLTALYNASNGSVLAVALWHGSWNWVATSDGLQGPWVAVMTAVVMLAAPVLIGRWGARDLAPRPRTIIPPLSDPSAAQWFAVIG
ncbi:MAG TPA: CPBP family intramembrane glutamic endopeptidase [Gemmatimonadales bacterium]|jgi:membrane protease YdiL (CAAX protease family)|nr:CPBP family intramembrane glutamic endopeptidase [Gemmatimonadales bacterium]